MADSLLVSASPAYVGLIGSGGNNICVPQGTSTEDFKEYLKRYEPDTFEALEKINKKYPPKNLSNEECKELMHKRVGAVRMPKPQQIKSFWQKVEGWFNKLFGKSNITADDVCDAIDKGCQIWDLSQVTPQSYTPVNLPNLNT